MKLIMEARFHHVEKKKITKVIVTLYLRIATLFSHNCDVISRNSDSFFLAITFLRTYLHQYRLKRAILRERKKKRQNCEALTQNCEGGKKVRN